VFLIFIDVLHIASFLKETPFSFRARSSHHKATRCFNELVVFHNNKTRSQYSDHSEIVVDESNMFKF
jgi:hypothetical protein